MMSPSTSSEISGFPKITQLDLRDPDLLRLNRLLSGMSARIPDASQMKAHATAAAQKVTSRIVTQSVTNNTTTGSGIYINVLDAPYLAVGDGTTDDAPAIKAAYDAAVAAGGGTVYLPGGHTYSVHGDIDLDSDVPVTFLGDGDSTIIIRGATITSGKGVFDIAGTAANITFQNFLTDGDKSAVPAQLQYSDFSGDPMDAQLTDNSMFWIHAGAKKLSWYFVNWTHTAGYGSLMNADTADIENIVFYGCRFENIRPHWFGVTSPDTIYGAWTGGIFYRGDCVSPNVFSVRNLTVLGCTFKRVNGNCIWGHCLGFDTHHTNVNVINNNFEDCALDCILMGNVYGGNVSGNIGHRIGYTTFDDTTASTPAFLPAKPATFIDNSGYVEAVTFGPNQVVSINGGAYDLDGVRNCTFSGIQADIPIVGTPQYTEDQIALYGPLQNGVLSSRGINMGNTSMNGGAVSVTLNEPKISGFGYAAICMSYAKNCKVISPHIVHPTGAAEPPILLFSASGSAETLNSGNVINTPHFTYAGVYYCVEERGTGWTTAVKNRVFDSEIIGVPAGEFLPDAATYSLSGVTTGNYTWREQPAPPVSGSGQSRTYMDSTSHKVKISENGAAYVNLAGGGGSVAGSNKWVQFNDSSSFGASTNMQYDKVLQKFTVTGITATSAIDAAGGFISSAEGFFTAYAQWNAIQATAGGLYGLNVSVGHYLAMASSVSPSPTGADAFTGNGVMHYDSGVTSFRFRYGTGTSTLADAFAVAAGFQATGSAGNDIQAPTGGVSGKYLIATDSLFFIQEAAPAVSAAGQSRVYMDSTSHTVKISQHGGGYVDIVGASSVAGSNTQVQYNNSSSFGASSSFTWNDGTKTLAIVGAGSNAAIAVTSGYIDSAVGFLSTAAASTTVNIPNGGVTALSLISIRNDGANGVTIARTSATARNYGFAVDSSGNLLLTDATASATRMTVTTAGLFTWGSAVSIDQAGALSASGVVSSTGASGGFNVTTQSAYNSFQSVSGGFKGRSLTAGVYVQVGQNSGTPSATSGDTVTDGCLYYDTSALKLKARINGSFVDVQTGAAGGVTSLTGTANQVIVSASTGAVTLSTPQSIGTSSSVTFGTVTTTTVTLSTFGSSIVQGITTRLDSSGLFTGIRFTATNTGTSLTFANNNSNFTVDGNGKMTLASDIDIVGNYKTNGTTVINTSGTFTGAGLLCPANGIGALGFNPYNGSGYDSGYGSGTTVTIASTASILVRGGVITGVTAVSDGRLKTIDRPFEYGLAAVKGLRPMFYWWNDLALSIYKGINGKDLTFGFIAQNVAANIPEASGKDEHGYNDFNRDGILCALVVAMQELSRQVDELKFR